MNNYFYIDANGQQCGPVAGEELINLGVTRESLVWCAGMSAWEKAGSIPELSSLFAAVPPTPPSVVPPTPAPPQPANATTAATASSKPRHTELCPNNNLVWAILVTVMCCMPFGIPAIINSNKVEPLWNAGRKIEAIQKAEASRKWCWAGVICGLIWSILYFILMFATGMLEALC